MLKRWRILSFWTLVATGGLWICWWGASGFPLEGEICETTNPKYNCDSYNVILYSAWRIAHAANEWSALIAALATIAVAAFTWVLFAIARDQLLHNRHVERAYVKMSHSPPGLEFTSDGSNVEIDIRNHGRTPAKVTNVLLNSRFALTGKNLPLPPTYDFADSAPHRAFLVAGDNAFLRVNLDTTLGTINALPEGTVLCVSGYVDYIDAFGVRHRGGYARVFDGTLGPESNLPFRRFA